MNTQTTSTRRTAHMLMAAFTALLLLLAIAPGADAKGEDTKRGDAKRGDTALLAATSDCPDGWVLGRFGCQPENLTTKDSDVVSVRVFDASACPAKFVTASVPGGCLANWFKANTDGDVQAFVHVCPVEFGCEHFVLAAESLGGHCVGDLTGEYCVLPTGPGDHP